MLVVLIVNGGAFVVAPAVLVLAVFMIIMLCYCCFCSFLSQKIVYFTRL